MRAGGGAGRRPTRRRRPRSRRRPTETTTTERPTTERAATETTPDTDDGDRLLRTPETTPPTTDAAGPTDPGDGGAPVDAGQPEGRSHEHAVPRSRGATSWSAGSAPAACRRCSSPRDAVLERSVAVKLLAEHLAEDEDFVARFRREALAAARLQHPNIVQVFDSGAGRRERPALHRHGVRRRAVVCRDAARAPALDVGATVQHPARRLPWARVRAPLGRRAPRHQAGQPAAHRRRHPEAGRLRHREGGAPDAHHAGRRRCSAPRPTCRRSRPAARRPGRVGHLLARRLRLPVPDRAAAARVRVADRACAEAAERRRSRRSPTSATTSRARSTWRSAPLCSAIRTSATRLRSRWPRRSRPACGARRRTPRRAARPHRVPLRRRRPTPTGVLPRGNTEYIPPRAAAPGRPDDRRPPSAQYRQSAEVADRARKKQRNWGGDRRAVIVLALAAAGGDLPGDRARLGRGEDPRRTASPSQADELIDYIRAHEEGRE